MHHEVSVCVKFGYIGGLECMINVAFIVTIFYKFIFTFVKIKITNFNMSFSC